jgi:hypothetical protein
MGYSYIELRVIRHALPEKLFCRQPLWRTKPTGKKQAYRPTKHTKNQLCRPAVTPEPSRVG